MTATLVILSFLAGCAVVGGLWWATSPDAVLKRQLSRQARRVGDLRPCDLDWWEREL